MKAPRLLCLSFTQRLRFRSQTNKMTSDAAAYRAHLQCTHMNVDRLHSFDQLCDQCNQSSPLGWLYVCSQDSQLPEMSHPNFGRTDDTNTSASNTQLAAEMAELGLHPSIVEYCLQGQYTRSQAQRILGGRRNVLRGLASFSTLLETSPPGAFADCNFRCCHSCRPFLRERLPMSLDAVFEADQDQSFTSGFLGEDEETRATSLAEVQTAIAFTPQVRHESGMPLPGNVKTSYIPIRSGDIVSVPNTASTSSSSSQSLSSSPVHSQSPDTSYTTWQTSELDSAADLAIHQAQDSTCISKDSDQAPRQDSVHDTRGLYVLKHKISTESLHLGGWDDIKIDSQNSKHAIGT